MEKITKQQIAMNVVLKGVLTIAAFLVYPYNIFVAGMLMGWIIQEGFGLIIITIAFITVKIWGNK
ncbi:MAG: hypothetical protein WC365_01350 [Candidatus Babeliales bacterium]|jgi:hypothetical protein